MPYAIAFVLVAMTLVLAPVGAGQAQLYKWVDEKGVVNYGDKPPRNKNAQALGDKSGTVTVVPGMSRDELDQQRERDTQQRLRQLEREVDDLRAREGARAQNPPEPVYNEIYVPAYGYGRPVHRPPHRPGVKPHEPLPEPNHPIRVERPPERPAAAARSVQR